MKQQKSASKAEALVMCPASHVLPQHESYGDQTVGGTDNHDLLTAVINRRPGAGAKLAEAMPALGFKLSEALDGVDNPKAEAAYVVDVARRKSIFLGYEIDRQYEKMLGRPLADCEIGTSLDVDGRKAGVRWLRDWKFGNYSSWWQLYIQGMAVMWAPESKDLEVDAGFVHFDTYSREGEVYVSEDLATLYLSDMDDRAEDVLKAVKTANELEAAIAQGMPLSSAKTIEGKWCQYCAAFPHCPSKWKLAKSMLDLDISGHIDALTLEQCGTAWKKLAEIEKNIVAKTKDALKARLRAEGAFPLENGKFLRVIQMAGRESLDRPKVVALLREKGATKEEIADLFKQGAPYDQVKECK